MFCCHCSVIVSESFYLTPTDDEYLGFLSSILSSQKVLVTSDLCFLWKTVEQVGKAFERSRKDILAPFPCLFLFNKSFR